MSEVVLYDYWRSSASYRVRIALNLLGVDYQTVSINLLEVAHKTPEYLALNPQGLVPTLVIDGKTLTQSLAIVEYLAETRPECGLLPSDIADRQKVRALAYAVAMDIHPICNLHVVSHLMSMADKADAREEWMKHFITDGLGKLETMIGKADGAFSFGNTPTMADLCLVPQVYNARRWGVELTAFKRIVDIDAGCADLPAFQAAHPDRVKP
ncbi:maleylacetoacetate isomerase [Rhizobium leguminosarum]|uniref:Maleylacetoacetate isomerase n=1 Tax=Rhizobium leguminosarum bv. trifolii (strain WSM1325) TaxID=395491 RepID=C6AVJ3_RHILS|nr:maleylacetoacetate isomerase [Rhizobium leguminosarum]ACS55804.1 maleylacetoacetate isomerase [Rhizobium leguminosarum bv. trifolii WSM1325]MBY2908239.1 maleylacetoacetate isomerase [Rhizobium leguminosarum]MBY2948012.1 maleylacetoacetate isomerase [Rhizobium leguminosarum]MBY2995710.1 maleylacetoacetate isomerase [Rhizobium leguminosarum]MBY3023202.1 maleylacetoacetate isomerase [Rhizobium leguminosarum]